MESPVAHGYPQLAAEFFKLQEQRALLYSRLHQQFKVYLLSKAEAPFTRLLRQLTQGFSDVSQRILAIESRLREGAPEQAEHIRTVQSLEREKLRITMNLQALRKAFADEAFSWQHADYDPLGPTGHHASGCGCCSHAAAAQEPTPEEYHAAVQEAMQEHDRIVNDINAELQELRNELHDGVMDTC